MNTLRFFRKGQPAFAIGLMLLSLTLLPAFLGWFLKKVWDDEWAALKKEGNLLLVNSIRDIEGETFNRLIFKSDWADSLPPTPLSEVKIQPDSVRMIAVFNDKTSIVQKRWKMPGDTSVFRADTTIQIRMERPREPQTKGALSYILSINAPLNADSCAFPRDTAAVFQRLHAEFQKKLAASGLGVTYTLVRAQPESPEPPEAIATYLDLAGAGRYDLIFKNYNGYLFKKILPQLLFALFLFGAVSLAFWLIYRNYRRQQRLTDIKNDFIRNITHELKTPIATVSVAIEALQNFGAMDSPERAREYLGIAGSELNRLSLLVDKVLRMSLFEADKQVLKPEMFDFKQMLADILASMRLQFEKYQAQVQFVTDDGDFRLYGDRLHLASVAYNLIDNALKYSVGAPKVQIRLEKDAEGLQLTVSDQGKGIPAAYLDKIFERFFRVPTGDVHDVKGHGLGLSYVAGVVRQHRGRIQVQSEEGQGARFIVLLPTAQQQ